MVQVLTMRLSKTPMFRVDDWEDGVLVQRGDTTVGERSWPKGMKRKES